MNNIFTRSANNPILKPVKENGWEAKKLYNPGAIFHNGKYHLFYRAVGSGENWKSSIGYAISQNGEDFQRFDNPILLGTDDFEKRGLEDPRITKIGNKFYMTYAAYDGITPRLCTAISKDLKNWEKQGTAFSNWYFEKAGGVHTKWDDNGNIFTKPKPTEWSKSGALFSEKIDGKFWMLFGEYRIWFATSDDGVNYIGDQTPFLKPREGNFFDNTFVEMGPPPIRTEKGWLVLYHGINDTHWYQIGFLLLDLKNPRKVLFRSSKPVFRPEQDYEMSGIVDVLPGGLAMMQKMSEEGLKTFLAKHDAKGTMPRVTFCCGATPVDNILRIFYGASDSVICTATASIDDILSLTE
ncbi:MAG: hypothetical protein ABIA02_00860 [Candidatus Falkowbacteria bacterium]